MEKIKRLRCDFCANVFDAPEEPGLQFCSARCKKHYNLLLAPPDRLDGFYQKITPGDFLDCRRSTSPFFVIAYHVSKPNIPKLIRVTINDIDVLYDYYDYETGIFHSFREWPSNWAWTLVKKIDQALVEKGPRALLRED
jgi:hypothetical protein